MSEKITIDVGKLYAALPALRGLIEGEWIPKTLRECAVKDEAPPVSEDSRRLKVMREFFDACGYLVFPHQGLLVVETPSTSGATVNERVRPDWLTSKHALRIAAAEAIERGWHLTQTFCGTRVWIMNGAWLCDLVKGDTPESAIIAVTRAIQAQKGGAK